MLLRIDEAAVFCYRIGEGSGRPRSEGAEATRIFPRLGPFGKYSIESHRVSTPKKRFFRQSFRLDSVSRGDISRNSLAVNKYSCDFPLAFSPLSDMARRAVS